LRSPPAAKFLLESGEVRLTPSKDDLTIFMMGRSDAREPLNNLH